MVSAMQKRKEEFLEISEPNTADIGQLVVTRRSSSHPYSVAEEESQTGYEGEDDEEAEYSFSTQKKRAVKAKWKAKRGATTLHESIEGSSQSSPGPGVRKANGNIAGSPSRLPWYISLDPADELSNWTRRVNTSSSSTGLGPGVVTPSISDDEFHSYSESLESLTAADLGQALQRLSTSTDVEMTVAGPSSSGRDVCSSSTAPTHISPHISHAPLNQPSSPSASRPQPVSRTPQVAEAPEQQETSNNRPSSEAEITANSTFAHTVNGAERQARQTIDEDPMRQVVTLGSSDLFALTNTLRNLAHGLERVNEVIEKQHTMLASKIDALQTSSAPAATTSGSPASRKRRGHPYPRTEPGKRKECQKSFSSSIRKHLDKLLDNLEDPFASAEEAASFELLVKQDPGKRCCDKTNFRIDIKHGPHSPWNVSAALVFAEDYIQTHRLPMEKIGDVTHGFFTRVKSIKQFLNEKPDRREAKTQYGRKYGLFYRRLEAVLAFPDSKIHQDFVQLLGVDGMSSDEEDGADNNNPSYQVLTPRWRSAELTTFLHGLDSLYMVHRRLDSSRQRGNWPRPRRYDPLHPKFSGRTGYPRHLPRNAYDQGWLASFPNVTLSVNPTLPYNFTHSPSVFRHFLGMQCTPS